MLEDREKGVVYVPVTSTLLAQMNEWSEPVQYRIEHVGNELSLVFRKVGLQPFDLKQEPVA